MSNNGTETLEQFLARLEANSEGEKRTTGKRADIIGFEAAESGAVRLTMSNGLDCEVLPSGAVIAHSHFAVGAKDILEALARATDGPVRAGVRYVVGVQDGQARYRPEVR